MKKLRLRKLSFYALNFEMAEKYRQISTAAKHLNLKCQSLCFSSVRGFIREVKDFFRILSYLYA
jgi:hypothetical protein